MKSDGAGRMKLHLVLKFWYHESLIKEFFGAKKPKEKIQKRYGTAHRLFPYCIFNSIEETPISWTYQENDQGMVYERIELFTTVTYVQYMRYYPFVLKLLNLKVGTDGTAKTGVINLLPKLKKGKPDVDFGVFTKETSENRISDTGIDTGDVICRMVVRDLTENTLGNLAGIYTRVYTVFVFEAKWLENFAEYIDHRALDHHDAPNDLPAQGQTCLDRQHRPRGCPHGGRPSLRHASHGRADHRRERNHRAGTLRDLPGVCRGAGLRRREIWYIGVRGPDVAHAHRQHGDDLLHGCVVRARVPRVQAPCAPDQGQVQLRPRLSGRRHTRYQYHMPFFH